MSHRYFTDRIEGSRAFLTGEEAAHLARVLRAAPGDAVTLCDGAGTDYAAQVVRAAPDEVELAIISSAPSVSEPPLAVTLFVGMPKGDKLEWIIQKSTELGAAEICPFTSRFCIAKPKNEQVKLTRWNRIAREAAKQSGRGRVPTVGGAVSFDALCERIPDYDLALFCYERGGEPLAPGTPLHSRLEKARSVAIITGAEGGFSEEEAAQAKAAGATLLGLGPRILRCETAPLAALCAVMTLTGNLS